jgi:hypothetical protein
MPALLSTQYSTAKKRRFRYLSQPAYAIISSRLVVPQTKKEFAMLIPSDKTVCSYLVALQ